MFFSLKRRYTMKKILFLVTVIAFSSQVAAGWVNGYTKSNGTYVQGYNRSDSNNTVRDNYSYKGNTNPYTGAKGGNYNRDSPSSGYYDRSNQSYGSGSKSVWGR
jgi:hypothetical protein